MKTYFVTRGDFAVVSVTKRGYTKTTKPRPSSVSSLRMVKAMRETHHLNVNCVVRFKAFK